MPAATGLMSPAWGYTGIPSLETATVAYQFQAALSQDTNGPVADVELVAHAVPRHSQIASDKPSSRQATTVSYEHSATVLFP